MSDFDLQESFQLQNMYSVSEITEEIKELLELTFPPLWVRGEISNFTRHSSGHFYFSLKDAGAQISCVMWRNRNAMVFFTPQNGMKINAFGEIRVYEKRGNYQLEVSKMVPAGVGELALAFEQLKARLREEGLFGSDHKKALPLYPQRIGIVTSPTGAAIHDIVHVLQKKFPSVQILLRPATVQGDGAAEDIAHAIEEFNEFCEVDVLIVGRGGGTLEDLWAFNEEIVARAIYNSKIPVISAVGHEVDFTIADFVADHRAPTPTAAAEMAVPDREQLRQFIGNLLQSIISNTERNISSARERISALKNRHGFHRPVDLIRQKRQRVDELWHWSQMTLQHHIAIQSSRLIALQRQIAGLNPDSILSRGYSITLRAGNQVVTDSAQLQLDEQVLVRFHRGHINAQVIEKL